MRWAVYWSVVVTVAVMAAHAAAEPRESSDVSVAAASLQRHYRIPEDRAILLGLGILGIAYTYQRAWQNLRRRDG